MEGTYLQREYESSIMPAILEKTIQKRSRCYNRSAVLIISSSMFTEADLQVELIEYCDDKGDFYCKEEWDGKKGVIF